MAGEIITVDGGYRLANQSMTGEIITVDGGYRLAN